MAENSKIAKVVKLNVIQRRKIFNLKPQRLPPKPKACRPKGEYLGKADILLPIPTAIHIGGLSDIYFALFAHVGQKDGCATVYRRLAKFEITVKGPSWTMNTARTFLFSAEYFQRIWWYRQTNFHSKWDKLSKVSLKEILLSCPSIFKNPLHANILARHQRDMETIAKTTITLRDLNTGGVYKKFADVPILGIWNAETQTTFDLERRDANYPEDLERRDANYPNGWNAETQTTKDVVDITDQIGAIGKSNRKEIINKSIGKPNPHPEFEVNFCSGALMRLQTMTGGRGKYKLQAFDCELPIDHRKMAEYLSRAFFSAWRNTGSEKQIARSLCFETYAVSIGMSWALSRNRRKIIKVLNETAPYFCSCWAVEDNTLKFVMSRTSNRKQDFYNG